MIRLRKTQNEIVLEALQDHKWCSEYELQAYTQAYGNRSKRIAARIWDLVHKQGKEIERRYRKFPEYEYRLIEEDR